MTQITLTGTIVELQPLQLEHTAALLQAAADGELWNLKVTNVPGPDTIEARFFFSQDAVMLEDPATGSASANLGSLLAARGFRGTVTVAQGAAVERPSRLHIEVTDEGRVLVGGMVRDLGAGVLTL